MADTDKTKKTEAPKNPDAKKGLAAWLPLILTAVLMPVLAYGITAYVLVPQIRNMMSQPVHASEAEAGEEAPAETPGHGADTQAAPPSSAQGGGHGSGGTSALPLNGEYSYLVDKLVVNVRGSKGTRYLMVAYVLTGQDPNLPKIAEAQLYRLRHLSIGALRTKSIEDLDQPTAQNVISTELKSMINNTISRGSNQPLVDDLYFTEFAIQ